MHKIFPNDYVSVGIAAMCGNNCNELRLLILCTFSIFARSVIYIQSHEGEVLISEYHKFVTSISYTAIFSKYCEWIGDVNFS